MVRRDEEPAEQSPGTGVGYLGHRRVPDTGQRDVTDLSPVELLYKGIFIVITVSAVRESWGWIKHRRTKADLSTDV